MLFYIILEFKFYNRLRQVVRLIAEAAQVDVRVSPVTLHRHESQVSTEISRVIPCDREAVTQSRQRRFCSEVGACCVAQHALQYLIDGQTDKDGRELR